VLTHVFWIIAAACVFAALYYCLAAGMRNGDRPGDAEITALLSTGTQPDEARPVIVVHVRNPSGTPVLVALSARRALLPALLTEPRGVSVPWLTRRGKFLPGKYETIGVAPADGAAELGCRSPCGRVATCSPPPSARRAAGCACTGCGSAPSVTRQRGGTSAFPPPRCAEDSMARRHRR
jgi:hypothetical protein